MGRSKVLAPSFIEPTLRIDAVDESGRPSFSLIQTSASSGAPIVFYAFDLLRFENEI